MLFKLIERKNQRLGNPLNNLVLNGSVFSGKGEGAKFTCLPWVRSQVRKQLGFVPFEGTLNVRLTPESIRTKKNLLSSLGIKIVPAKGYCEGTLFRARIENVECGLIVPEVEGYPEDVVEIVAEENLRSRLGLADGDEVKIIVVV